MKKLKAMKLSILMVSFVFASAFCSFGQNNTGHGHDNHQDHAKQETHDDVMHATLIQKSQAEEILEVYLEIKDALVKTDGKAASGKAARMVELLSDQNDDLAKKIKFDAKHIADTKDVNHQREHFNDLSENVYTLIKATQANKTPLYKQYCPMALNNTGAFWLASEKEINNPYFGDRMLHCGSVKESLD